MNQSLIKIGGRQVHDSSAHSKLLRELHEAMSDQRAIAGSTTTTLFATESVSDLELTNVKSAHSNLMTTVKSVAARLFPGVGEMETALATETAAYAGLLASDPAAFVSHQSEFPKHGNSNMFVVGASDTPGYVGHRSNIFATEAFDNRETRNAVLYTMAYNYSVVRQGEFGETVWPTLVLPADQVGFGIVVNRLTIHRGVTHTVDGKIVDFNKRDLMRAEADHTILLKEKTRLYPVFRPTAASKFVDTTLIAPVKMDNEGVEIMTAPYRVGEEIGIMGICQTDAQLEAGSANQTDTMDPAISLEKVYVKIGDDIVAFNVYSQPFANFTYAPQGLDKLRVLNYRGKANSISKHTKQVNGSDLTTLAAVATNEYTVVVDLALGGEANTEFASVAVYGNRVAIVKIVDTEGKHVPDTNPVAVEIKDAFAQAKIIGYELRAYKTNINMRERGDFIDRTSFTQLYEVPLLSPITAQRPQNTDGTGDAGDFEALVTTTRFRRMNDAVTAIFDCTKRLGDYVNSGPSGEDIPAAIGAARYHVRPTYYEPADPIDVTELVQSLDTANLAANLQAGIVNIVRDYAFRMFVHSEYQAAAQALGQVGNPTVIIATDPILHRYLQIEGDLRTLTEKFNVRVVSTLDRRFTGKMFITFGVFDDTRNQAPNLLNWGNLIFAPEVVMMASVPRGESMSRETIVQPRYLFVNHLPIATMLTFTNVPDLFKDGTAFKVKPL